MRQFLFVLLITAGCNHSVATPHNFDQINADIIQPTCAAFSVCHSAIGSSMAGHLRLDSDPWTALVQVPADNKKAHGEGKVRVAPCDPDASFLVIKLELPESVVDPDSGYGGHMPSKNPSLPPAQVQAVRDWIARGAKRDEPADVTGTTCDPDSPLPDLGIVDLTLADSH